MRTRRRHSRRWETVPSRSSEYRDSPRIAYSSAATCRRRDRRCSGKSVKMASMSASMARRPLPGRLSRTAVPVMEAGFTPRCADCYCPLVGRKRSAENGRQKAEVDTIRIGVPGRFGKRRIVHTPNALHVYLQFRRRPSGRTDQAAARHRSRRGRGPREAGPSCALPRPTTPPRLLDHVRPLAHRRSDPLRRRS